MFYWSLAVLTSISSAIVGVRVQANYSKSFLEKLSLWDRFVLVYIQDFIARFAFSMGGFFAGYCLYIILSSRNISDMNFKTFIEIILFLLLGALCVIRVTLKRRFE